MDVDQRAVFSFTFDVTKIPLLLESKFDIFFTINRRKGCYHRSLIYLKDLIEKQEEIMTISYIFHKIIEHYEKARTSRRDLFPAGQIVPAPPVEVVHNGYNIITPNDLQQEIFGPFSQDEVELCPLFIPALS